MKYKTTQKEIKSGYYHTICVPYCGLQDLLSYENPVAYTTRAEGWGADIYEIDSNTCIVTGYAPFGRYRPDYKTLEKWNRAAVKKCSQVKLENHKRSLEILLKKFAKEITEGK